LAIGHGQKNLINVSAEGVVMQIINKAFSIDEFKSYTSSVNIAGWAGMSDIKKRLQFPVVHNTSSPTQALYKSWHDRKDWTIEQWGRNLASYYAGMGWQGCPHLFVAYDKILVLNPLDKRGTHTPSWNYISWGIETVAEFESEAFDGGVKDNLIAAVAILCAKATFNPADFVLGRSGIHFHKEDAGTTHKNCPGRNLVKTDFVASVVDYMNKNLGTKYNAPVFETSHPHISIASQIADTSALSNDEMISIKWVQERLNALGFGPLKTDGIVGTLTKNAVKKFQSEKWLDVDGIAGPLTRKALKDAK